MGGVQYTGMQCFPYIRLSIQNTYTKFEYILNDAEVHTGTGVKCKSRINAQEHTVTVG